MINTTILCWNARGLNGRAWRDSVRTLVQSERPHVVCIVETKLSFVSQMPSLLGMNFVDYAFVPAAGTCGGILVAGQQPDIRLDDVHVGCFSITVKVHTGPDIVCPPWCGSRLSTGHKTMEKSCYS